MEKGKVQKQSPLEHLFELPEYLRFDHRLKRIVSCFLGMMQAHSFAIPVYFQIHS